MTTKDGDGVVLPPPRKRYSYTLSKYNKPIHELPPVEEIDSPEIDVSYAGMRAMSYFFANYCDKERGVSEYSTLVSSIPVQTIT